MLSIVTLRFFSQLLQPPGFPAQDEFDDPNLACEVLTERYVSNVRLQKPILNWCRSRVFHASRGEQVKSLVDGSWIHDRDRVAAFKFYKTGLRSGYINPDVCPFHTVDKKQSQPTAVANLVMSWPYNTHCDYQFGSCSARTPGRMKSSKAKFWLRHSPDYERFGTRGPIDNNYWVGVKYLGGCFPPEALDRYDVSIAITVKRSLHLCEKLESWIDTKREKQAMRAFGFPTKCKTAADIREIWHPNFWYKYLRLALSSA